MVEYLFSKNTHAKTSQKYMAFKTFMCKFCCADRIPEIILV